MCLNALFGWLSNPAPSSNSSVRACSMLALPQPSMRSLQHIYQVQLGRFFQEGDFMPEVKDSLFPLVSASIAIYYRMIGAMRPTPAKMHYSFNVRDLSQVSGTTTYAPTSTLLYQIRMCLYMGKNRHGRHRGFKN